VKEEAAADTTSSVDQAQAIQKKRFLHALTLRPIRVVDETHPYEYFQGQGAHDGARPVLGPSGRSHRSRLAKRVKVVLVEMGLAARASSSKEGQAEEA
jgi:hypothetical protein